MIHIGEENIQKMIRHSLDQSPKEACGILAGRVGEGQVWISKIFECENVHPNPTVEYSVRPEDQLRTFREIEESDNTDLAGFYHSHPRGPDSPSQIDVSRNYWPGYLIAIVSLSPEPLVSFWRWKDGRYHPEKMVRERF